MLDKRLDGRNELIDRMRMEMLGPGSELSCVDVEHEILSADPSQRYCVGILYPQGNVIGLEDDDLDSKSGDSKEEVIADREFGGDNLEQSKAYVSRALNTFGDDDLKSFVKEGFGFRPSLFKLLARTGKMLSDDRFVKGSQVHEESAYERNKRRYPKSPELWGSPDQ